MTEKIQARIGAEHIAKLQFLEAQIGLTTPQVIRFLIEHAEVVQPAKVTLSTNAKSDAIRQDSTVAFAN
jgi:hypothetical protein